MKGTLKVTCVGLSLSRPWLPSQHGCRSAMGEGTLAALSDKELSATRCFLLLFSRTKRLSPRPLSLYPCPMLFRFPHQSHPQRPGRKRPLMLGTDGDWHWEGGGLPPGDGVLGSLEAGWESGLRSGWGLGRNQMTQYLPQHHDPTECSAWDQPAAADLSQRDTDWARTLVIPALWKGHENMKPWAPVRVPGLPGV